MQSCVIVWHISTNEGGFPTWCVWKTCYTHSSTHKLSGDWAKIACLVVYPRCNCLSLVYVLQSINGSYSGWWSPSFLEKVYTLKEWHVNCSKRSRILTKQREQRRRCQIGRLIFIIRFLWENYVFYFFLLYVSRTWVFTKHIMMVLILTNLNLWVARRWIGNNRAYYLTWFLLLPRITPIYIKQ